MFLLDSVLSYVTYIYIITFYCFLHTLLASLCLLTLLVIKVFNTSIKIINFSISYNCQYLFYMYWIYVIVCIDIELWYFCLISFDHCVISPFFSSNFFSLLCFSLIVIYLYLICFGYFCMFKIHLCRSQREESLPWQ